MYLTELAEATEKDKSILLLKTKNMYLAEPAENTEKDKTKILFQKLKQKQIKAFLCVLCEL